MFGVYIPEDHSWFCFLRLYVYYSSYTCSNYFILSMAFERFYSIITPHRAASFNTVKRAKITITCFTVFSCSYHIPYFKIYQSNGKTCVPLQNLVYYWVYITVRGVLPFILLLVMNSAIISTLHKRSMDQGQLQGRTQGQDKMKFKTQKSNCTKGRSMLCYCL